MRITIPEDIFPELANLPRGVLTALVRNALHQYVATMDCKTLIRVFAEEITKPKDKKVNKATLYKSNDKNDTSVVEIPQVAKSVTTEKTAIDDNSIDIMGGFNYE